MIIYFALLAATSLANPRRHSINVTLVTAYFPHPGVNPNHPDRDEYHQWIKNFLTNIATPILIYSPPDIAPMLQSMRPQHLPLYIDTSYKTIWEVPVITQHKEAFHNEQIELAREAIYLCQDRESPHLYGVWTAKSFFLGRAATMDYFNSSHFFWHDIAAFRDSTENFSDWPDPLRIHDVFTTSAHKDAVLVNVRSRQPCYLRIEDLLREPAEQTMTISGVFFGGSKQAVLWLSHIYYFFVEHYISVHSWV
ncbi:hypothetical protein GQ44DRAFT_555369, partial [Phaeosphaeriaceae sp. PMI808]